MKLEEDLKAWFPALGENALLLSAGVREITFGIIARIAVRLGRRMSIVSSVCCTISSIAASFLMSDPRLIGERRISKPL